MARLSFQLPGQDNIRKHPAQTEYFHVWNWKNELICARFPVSELMWEQEWRILDVISLIYQEEEDELILVWDQDGEGMRIFSAKTDLLVFSLKKANSKGM